MGKGTVSVPNLQMKLYHRSVCIRKPVYIGFGSICDFTSTGGLETKGGRTLYSQAGLWEWSGKLTSHQRSRCWSMQRSSLQGPWPFPPLTLLLLLPPLPPPGPSLAIPLGLCSTADHSWHGKHHQARPAVRGDVAALSLGLLLCVCATACSISSAHSPAPLYLQSSFTKHKFKRKIIINIISTAAKHYTKSESFLGTGCLGTAHVMYPQTQS